MVNPTPVNMQLVYCIVSGSNFHCMENMKKNNKKKTILAGLSPQEAKSILTILYVSLLQSMNPRIT